MAEFKYAVGAAIAAFVVVLIEFILIPIAMQIGTTALGNNTLLNLYPGTKGILQVMPILVGAVGVVVVAGMLYKAFE